MFANYKFLLFFFLLIQLTFSCSEKDTLPDDEFVKIYVDILIAQDTTTNSISTDSLKSIVLSKYGVSYSEYQKTIDSYNETPEKWEEIFDKSIKYVDSLKTKTKK